MYTTTWGPAKPNDAYKNYHSKKNIVFIRAFVEAVLDYTKAPKVNIIGHSMGVTIGRKIIKGGNASDYKDGTYYLGGSLKSRVKTFIGLAGANMGLN
jgi:triacylglycerol lipase